jgi:hypothetical protein
MLSIMARQHACPYTQEPKDQLKPDELYWSPYDGMKNASDAGEPVCVGGGTHETHELRH